MSHEQFTLYNQPSSFLLYCKFVKFDTESPGKSLINETKTRPVSTPPVVVKEIILRNVNSFEGPRTVLVINFLILELFYVDIVLDGGIDLLRRVRSSSSFLSGITFFNSS